MACGWLGGCREGNYLLGESPLHSEAEYSPSTGTEASHCSQWSHGSSTAILIRVGAQLVSSDLHFISPIRSIRSFSSIQESTRLSMHFSIYIEHERSEKWTFVICYFDNIWRIDFVIDTFLVFKRNSLVFRYDFTMTRLNKFSRESYLSQNISMKRSHRFQWSHGIWSEILIRTI